MKLINETKLKKWFLKEKRDLPWRKNPTPYQVWVSEVMLQQTQVSVVIPYFERWMSRYPSIKDLAEAPLTEIIKVWEGLGYYSRVRNLHAGAKYIVEYFGGEVPSSEEDLKKIKGLGPYTIGAILSFAFKKRATAVDANVMRVLARFYRYEEDISKPKSVSHLRNLAAETLPESDTWIFNEALIELGAVICSRKPKCVECPLSGDCQAYKEGKEHDLPIKLKKIKTEYLYRSVLVLRHNDEFLVMQGEKGKVMHDLHEFPYETTDEFGMTIEEIQKLIEKKLKLKVRFESCLQEERHSFTKYQVTLKPISFHVTHKKSVSGYQWMSIEKLKDLAFSSGHRRIFKKLITNT